MTIHRTPVSRRNGQSGVVLILVMLVMLVLMGLGLTALWLTSSNVQIAANLHQRAMAFYVAEAGIEHARNVLNAPAAPTLEQLMTGATPAGDDVPTGLTPAGLPNGVGAILVDGVTPLRSVEYPPSSFGRPAGTAERPTARLMGSYTVWIRNDTADIRRGMYRTEAAANPNNTVVIRSLGVAPDGRTNVVLEVTMGPGTAAATPGAPGAVGPVPCLAGKNACDDNSSTSAAVVY